MSITLYDAVVKTYQQILPAVGGFLEKGKAHFDAESRDVQDAVGLKLAEDMLPLHFQVVSVVHHSMNALNSAASGEATPPDFKLAFDYAGLQGHVQTAIDAVGAADADAINALADNPVVFRMGNFEMPFTASDYLLSFSMPNFYFHATTLYGLLRKEGVGLGKMDFLGPLRIKA